MINGRIQLVNFLPDFIHFTQIPQDDPVFVEQNPDYMTLRKGLRRCE